ncbi:transcriptional regulator [Streptomyces sp. NPDC087425]|uniref:helix-turn-helix transcriptional regulator n=1 Tax=Streptomyces sp. NPDC087425 TaxID=3365787 RepID=UPI0037F2E58F
MAADETAADPSADELLASYARMVPGLQQTFGGICEVVLHDYRRTDRSVIAVAGQVTGREVGSPMSRIGLSMLRRGDDADDDLNYVTRLPDGRVVKSSTLLIRTAAGRVVGALCVNLDVTELRGFRQILADLAGTGDAGEPLRSTTFSPDPDAVIQEALADAEARLGRPLTRLTVAERTEVFRRLERTGVFQLRRTVPVVAERLGLSRASVYNYLARVRAEDAPEN